MDAIKAMPHIVDNIYVQVDPAVATIYNFLICQTWLVDDLAHELPQDFGRQAYQHLLQHLPPWSTMTSFSDLDLAATVLVVYSAKEYYDIRTARKVFLQGAHIARSLGLFDFDSAMTPAEPSPDHERDEARRLTFWQLMREECFFRTFYNMPPVLSAGPWNINLPSSLINDAGDQKGMMLATVLVSFGKLILILLDCLRVMDDVDLTQGEVSRKLEESFWQIKTWLDEWEIDESFEKASNLTEKRLYADTLVFAHSLLVVWQEKMRSHSDSTRIAAHESARRVILVGLEIARVEPTDAYRRYCNTVCTVSTASFVSFYHLRRLLFHGDDAASNTSDGQMLETYSALLIEAAKVHSYHNLMPIAKYLYSIATDYSMDVEPGLLDVV